MLNRRLLIKRSSLKFHWNNEPQLKRRFQRSRSHHKYVDWKRESKRPKAKVRCRFSIHQWFSLNLEVFSVGRSSARFRRSKRKFSKRSKRSETDSRRFSSVVVVLNQNLFFFLPLFFFIFLVVKYLINNDDTADVRFVLGRTSVVLLSESD